MIKFYPNTPDNMHCSQAVFRSLFKYFFDEELSWEEIDKITKAIPGRGSWTMAAYIELANRDVEVVNIEEFDYQRFYNERVEYLKEIYNDDAIKYTLEKSNLLSVRDDIPEFLQKVKRIKRKATIKDFDKLLDNGYLVGTVLNSRVLNEKEGFSLHYVLIKEKEGNKYIINDPGLPPVENRKVTKDQLLQAFQASGGGGEVTGFKLTTDS